jgi:hypothetical protein
MMTKLSRKRKRFDSKLKKYPKIPGVSPFSTIGCTDHHNGSHKKRQTPSTIRNPSIAPTSIGLSTVVSRKDDERVFKHPLGLEQLCNIVDSLHKVKVN